MKYWIRKEKNEATSHSYHGESKKYGNLKTNRNFKY